MLLFLFCLVFFSPDSPVQAQSIPEDQPLDTLFKGLKFRNIGPFRGGRSVASCGVIQDNQTYYMGSTGGGIWKTTDAGITWINISDGQLNTGSVGAIAVSESDPNVIYAGMGEHAVRGVMTSHGDGIYKSTDAGKTWKHMGLADSRHIAEIRIHPGDPEVVWVAVQGALHGDSESRGVYKSVDGGASWKKVLYVDEKTGAADLTIDHSNPRILFASMWDHRRTPWQVRSGGAGSAIYKSTDGGESWEKVSGGLPDELGKTAVDISRANPMVIYANVESEGTKGGVYRSDDAGKTWNQTTKDRITVARAWYYIEIFADPQDENTVYVLNAPMLKSIDGGKSFRSIRNPHGDQHHMWINPDHPDNIILSNDGGACVTFNGGQSWSSQQNQPTIQFYRVITDNLFPYNVYGGQQDNSSIVTASRTTGGGIGWKDWFSGPGCECAFIAFDPDHPTLMYGGCYQGNIEVMDRETREGVDIMAYPTAGLGWTPGEMKYRFNWNAPIVASPQDPNVIYHCSNQVLVTRNQGMTWTELSPDLTRNEKSKQVVGGTPYTNEGAGGEVYNTISYLEASPHSDQVLWAGSDCGLVHVTQDAGASWQNVTPDGLEESLINAIDVSPHDAATAYIAVTRYKFNDFTPLIYRTDDFGKNWDLITEGIATEDFVRVVREDMKRPGLLYAGTETGLYISYNNGDLWERINLNLPVCPITDLTFRDNDLVIATSGRSFWILDDLAAVQSGWDVMGDALVLYTPKPSYRVTGGGSVRPGRALGQNPLSGMTIDYYIPEGHDDSLEVRMEILDEEGTNLRSYSSKPDKNFMSFPGGPSRPRVLPVQQGVNRFNWDLRRMPVEGVDKVFLLGGYSGARVPPGNYTIRMKVGDQTTETVAQLKADPRIPAEPHEYIDQYELMIETETMAKKCQKMVNQLRGVKSQLTVLNKLAKNHPGTDALVSIGDSIVNVMKTWEEKIIQPDQKTFQDVINFPNRLNAEITSLLSRMSGMQPKVSNGIKQRLADLRSEYAQRQSEKDHIVNVLFTQYNELFKASEIDVLTIPDE